MTPEQKALIQAAIKQLNRHYPCLHDEIRESGFLWECVQCGKRGESEELLKVPKKAEEFNRIIDGLTAMINSPQGSLF